MVTTVTVTDEPTKLFHHKTSGGAEYLFDTFILCPNGHQEGVINDQTRFVVRIDGDITKDAELTVVWDRLATTCPPRPDQYEIKQPANAKEGLRNQMKMVFNQLVEGNHAEARLQLDAIIDDLNSECVQFEWMSTRQRNASQKQSARNLARYCVENPAAVD